MPRSILTIVVCVLISGTCLVGCGGDDVAGPASPWDAVYVDGTKGRDGAAGTAADPLRTIEAALALAVAEGLDVRVAGGIYDVSGSAEGLAVDVPVSIYGGYRNDRGDWSRDADSRVTEIRNVVARSDVKEENRFGIICTHGAQDGAAPVIDGLRVVVASDGGAIGIVVTNGSAAVISDCDVYVPAANVAVGIHCRNYYGDVHTVVDIVDSSVHVSADDRATGISSYKGRMTVRNTVVADLAGRKSTGISVGTGEVVIADCTIGGGNSRWETCALSVSYAVSLSVTGCAVDGGTGRESVGIRVESLPEPYVIAGNTIDGGSGSRESVGIAIGFPRAAPVITGNMFTASGSGRRCGIKEAVSNAEAATVTGNSFGAELLEGSAAGCFYLDNAAGVETLVATIEGLNALDEDGLNEPGTVADNVIAAR